MESFLLIYEYRTDKAILVSDPAQPGREIWLQEKNGL